MAEKIINLSLEEISSRLSQVSDSPPDKPRSSGLVTQQPRPAAVLIPFLHKEGEWHILFTRRTDNLPEHSGQVAFPGGRTDPQDSSPVATALREADEEISLKPDVVKILGSLKRLPTITNYFVTPIVGAIPWPYEFSIKEEEVSKIFTIPLKWLSDPNNHKIHQRVLSVSNKLMPVVYFKQYDGELLWGVSARITINLLQTLNLL
jgi:8-oxo-dGTP pyrophosphatase MutT (NUDIX family)